MKDNKNDRKKKGRKSERVAFILSFLTLTGILPFGGLVKWLLILGVSSGIGKVIGTMAEGLDLTTHNKGDDERRAREAAEAARRAEESARKAEEERKKAEARSIPLSGDAEADAVIEKGKDMLRQIREANAAIPDAALTSQMNDLEHLCTQIFKTISEKPAKAPQIRKFMNYYLPTTLKMLGSYRVMQDRGVSATDLVEARTTLIRGMSMVLTACQKQLDNLFKEDLLDVSTDIDVLEQMLKRDGFADGGLGEIKPGPGARTAASATMGAQPRPILQVKPESETNEPDSFRSFYDQSK